MSRIPSGDEFTFAEITRDKENDAIVITYNRIWDYAFCCGPVAAIFGLVFIYGRDKNQAALVVISVIFAIMYWLVWRHGDCGAVLDSEGVTLKRKLNFFGSTLINECESIPWKSVKCFGYMPKLIPELLGRPDLFGPGLFHIDLPKKVGKMDSLELKPRAKNGMEAIAYAVKRIPKKKYMYAAKEELEKMGLLPPSAADTAATAADAPVSDSRRDDGAESLSRERKNMAARGDCVIMRSGMIAMAGLIPCAMLTGLIPMILLRKAVYVDDRFVVWLVSSVIFYILFVWLLRRSAVILDDRGVISETDFGFFGIGISSSAVWELKKESGKKSGRRQKNDDDDKWAWEDADDDYGECEIVEVVWHPFYGFMFLRPPEYGKSVIRRSVLTVNCGAANPKEAMAFAAKKLPGRKFSPKAVAKLRSWGIDIRR